MKIYGWVKVQIHALTSALDGGEWSAPGPGRFTPGEWASSSHWIAGWVGPRAGLDAEARRKILTPCRESNPGGPARSLVTILTELRGSLINLSGEFNSVPYRCSIISPFHAVQIERKIRMHLQQCICIYAPQPMTHAQRNAFLCTLVIVIVTTY
jgi:hypothetical protein